MSEEISALTDNERETVQKVIEIASRIRAAGMRDEFECMFDAAIQATLLTPLPVLQAGDQLPRYNGRDLVAGVSFDTYTIASAIVRGFPKEAFEMDFLHRQSELMRSCEKTLERLFPDKIDPVLSPDEQDKIRKVLHAAAQTVRAPGGREKEIFAQVFPTVIKSAGLDQD